MNDDFSVMRERSRDGALTALENVRRDALDFGLTIVVSNDGHHWRFLRGRQFVLSYWPTSAKAQRVGGLVFRCRGHYAALKAASATRLADD